MRRLIGILFALVIALAMPLSGAWAASGDLDEILNYEITVDVNDDATLTMSYHIDWKVLDSTSEGPLTWVKIGIPNSHYLSMESTSSTVKKIGYTSSGGSYARIDLDRSYHAGEVVSFDFTLVQDYMYQVGRDNQGEAVYEFTPGWFDDARVDNLTIKWNDAKVTRFAPSAEQDKGYYTWSTSLAKGQRYKVTVGYPDNAFAFDVDKTIQAGSGDDDGGFWDIFGTVALAAMVIAFFWGMIAFLVKAALGIGELFVRGSGFIASRAQKKITRTKVVYYPECQGCAAPRPEGKDNCEYCGRSFIKSEEVIEEKDIPAAESALRGMTKDGEYAFSSEPDTFLRVRAVPIVVSSGSRHRSAGSGRSCACASSCACACGCACACACAGGGRAGCTTKDFYNTGLKLDQLKKRR